MAQDGQSKLAALKSILDGMGGSIASIDSGVGAIRMALEGSWLLICFLVVWFLSNRVNRTEKPKKDLKSSHGFPRLNTPTITTKFKKEFWRIRDSGFMKEMSFGSGRAHHIQAPFGYTEFVCSSDPHRKN